MVLKILQIEGAKKFFLTLGQNNFRDKILISVTWKRLYKSCCFDFLADEIDGRSTGSNGNKW